MNLATEVSRTTNLRLSGLSEQQRMYFEACRARVVAGGPGDETDVAYLPIVPERLISIPEKLYLMSHWSTIEPLGLLWQLAEIERHGGQDRPQRPYHLINLRLHVLNLSEDSLLKEEARKIKDNCCQAALQPLTVSELLDLILFVPKILSSGRFLSLVGYSAGPLPELVSLPGGKVILRLAEKSDGQGQWLVPAGRIIDSPRTNSGTS